VRSLIVACCVLSSAAFAQEIGTEIAPPSPPPAPRAQPALGPAGLKVSASASDFGFRAGFGTTFVTLATGSGSAAATVAPAVGAQYFLTDAVKLLLDVGFGVVANPGAGTTVWEVAAKVGADYLFRTPADALRPLVSIAASFGVGAGNGDPAVKFGVELGGGAEYFFSPSFSVYGRIGLALPMDVPNGDFRIGLFTLTPGVGASFYF
jgi:hypothetical protein